MKKVLLIQMPGAVEQALREQMAPFREIEMVSLKKGAAAAAGFTPDLVLTAEEKPAAFPGCPVLPLSWNKPKRLGALLRQISQMLLQPVLYIDDIILGVYVLKPQEKSLMRPGGEEISLTDREVDILAYLARHPGKAVSREELLKNVWQYQESVDTHTLETHMYRLRQKIEARADDPRFLLTVDGGYSLHLPKTGV